MSASSKSKPKDKKAGKEPQKASSKPPGAANAGNTLPASAYNPLSGTFHAVEVVPTSSASSHYSGRFRNIDETDDHSGGVDYDSVSNNGSWSGESEEHKEKLTSNLPLRPETIPGADNDKREKIRQKNERKHQRQKERRAQELHERCSGYLMSRKLEALAQQLVAMGFQHERATIALILNEGKLEESVSWLFEGGENPDNPREQAFGGGNLKIDISEELARMTEMELKYRCTRQDVERAIVASEGDIEKAAETLRDLKIDPPTASANPEQTGDPPIASSSELPAGVNQNVVRQQQQQPQQQKPSVGSVLQQHRRDDQESSYKTQQPLKKVQPKQEWARPQQTTIHTDKRLANAGSNPSASYSLASSVQVSPPIARTEPRLAASGSDYRSFHPATVREPVIMMQRPQSASTKQVAVPSMSSSHQVTAGSWYPPSSNIDNLNSNGLMPQVPTTRSVNANDLNPKQLFHYPQHQPFSQGDFPGTSRGNGTWNRTGTSHTLTAASSLGLFSGLGGSSSSSGSSPPVDWSTTGSVDYTSIDWTLDRGLSTPKPGGLWTSDLGARMAMRSAVNGSGVGPPGLQDGVVNAGSQEWGSPFEEQDLFSLPRHFVSSPSL